MKQSRIGLLFFSLMAVVTMVISCTTPAPTPAPTPTPSPASTPVPIPTTTGSLSLVDAHEHITPGLAGETIISLMDQAGVHKTSAGSGLVYLDYFGKMVQCQVSKYHYSSLLQMDAGGVGESRRCESRWGIQLSELMNKV